MFRKTGYIALALLAANCFWSCEKDDICAEGTPTTPSLVVEFFNADSPATPRAVPDLLFFSDDNDTIKATNTSKIQLPLKPGATSTKWGLIYRTAASNPDDDPVLNTDFLDFSYTTVQTYVSRACGYRTTYLLDTPTTGNDNPDLTDSETEGLDFWIQSVQIATTNIENENETHIRIYY